MTPGSRPRRPPGPPGLSQRILRLCLPPGGYRESVLGDLEEGFHRRAAAPGGSREDAARWYRRRALDVAWAYARIRLSGRRLRPLEDRSTERTMGRGGGMGRIGGVGGDVRFAWRSLRRSPGFLAVAVVTLALAIGADTAIFSVVRGAYLRPLEFRDADRLVRVGSSALDGRYRMAAHTAGEWVSWRERAVTLEGLTAFSWWTTVAEHGDRAERVQAVRTLGSLFQLLGVDAARGRVFSAGEAAAGARLAVVAPDFAERAFGGDDPVGRTLVLGGEPWVVVGVAPATFGYPDPSVEVWASGDLPPGKRSDHRDQFLNTVARLAPGRTLAQARQEMRAVSESLAREHPDAHEGVTAEVVPLRDTLLGDSATLWSVLAGGVALVLALACMNLTHLLLARGRSRESEFAVRGALGAGRARLARQLLVESLVLAGLGGAAGVLVGWLGLEGLLAWMPGGVPRPGSVRLDGGVLAFTLLVTVGAGLAVGLIPALRTSRVQPAPRLRARGEGRAGGAGRLLVATEIAVGLVLLTAAGLLLRGWVTVTSVDPGFETRDRLTFFLEPTGDGWSDEARWALHRRVEERVRSIPGVAGVGLISVYPASGFTPGADVDLLDRETGTDRLPSTRYVVVSPGWREAVGVPLLRGRDLGPDDHRSGTPAVLVNAAFAALYFPGGDALGRRVALGPDGVVAPASTIVGVVGDVRRAGLDEPPPPAAYVLPETATFWRGFDVVVHVDEPRPGLAEEIRRTVRSLAPGLTVLEARPADRILRASLAGQRNVLLLFSLLAGVALAMATVGVYGVVAFQVSRRTREIGIRMAVGAERGVVERRVVLEGLVPVVAGCLVGLAAAAGLTRFLDTLLVGVEAVDPVTFASTAGLLFAAALLAVWLPVRRAARLDPARVLRTE